MEEDIEERIRRKKVKEREKKRIEGEKKEEKETVKATFGQKPNTYQGSR